MTNLMRASRELFRRTPDETFPSLDVFQKHFQWQKDQSTEIWQPPRTLHVRSDVGSRLMLDAGDDGAYEMNDWSFGQLCRLSGIARDTVNRLTPDTATRVFAETLPRGQKPLQVFTLGGNLRSIHAASYTRLHNADLVEVVKEVGGDFEPPPKGFNGATGLYGGEQDMFCFLIDPVGWIEIDGQEFAPGFFLWNSEVGCRSVGIETFWFQQICQNHIVWDAVEVIEFSRKHTANVYDALSEIRQAIEALVRKRDERRDGFLKAIRHAMETTLGGDAEEVEKVLSQIGVARNLAKEAIASAQENGRFTVFAMVAALTRIARRMVNAGERLPPGPPGTDCRLLESGPEDGESPRLDPRSIHPAFGDRRSQSGYARCRQPHLFQAGQRTCSGRQ
ncbi:MAG: DUF932 domain-containing protein [Thermoguttaceae bacterium]|jgi:hypothetical protein